LWFGILEEAKLNFGVCLVWNGNRSSLEANKMLALLLFGLRCCSNRSRLGSDRIKVNFDYSIFLWWHHVLEEELQNSWTSLHK